jgi:hypothetical protein
MHEQNENGSTTRMNKKGNNKMKRKSKKGTKTRKIQKKQQLGEGQKGYKRTKSIPMRRPNQARTDLQRLQSEIKHKE